MPKRVLWLLLFLALVLRLFIAAVFFGSWDTESVYVVSDLLKKGSMVYNETWRLNSPPIWLWMIGLLSFAAEKSGIPLSFWAKIPFILGDFGVAFLIYKLAKTASSNPKTPLLLMFLYLFSPLSLWISAYQGQLESPMLFLILLSIWFLIKETHECRVMPVVKSGLAIGMAATIKLVPLGLVPVFLLFLAKKMIWEKEKILGNLGKLGLFGGLSVVPLILIFLPFISVWDTGVVPHVIGYKTAWGIWGTSLILRRISEADSLPQFVLTLVEISRNQTFSVLFLSLATYVYLILSKKNDLLYSVGLIFLVVTVFSPFLAPQYLLWIVPFWLLLKRKIGYFVLFNTVAVLSFFLLFSEWQNPTVFDYWAAVFKTGDPRQFSLNLYTFFSLAGYFLTFVFLRIFLKKKV